MQKRFLGCTWRKCTWSSVSNSSSSSASRFLRLAISFSSCSCSSVAWSSCAFSWALISSVTSWHFSLINRSSSVKILPLSSTAACEKLWWKKNTQVMLEFQTLNPSGSSFRKQLSEIKCYSGPRISTYLKCVRSLFKILQFLLILLDFLLRFSLHVLYLLLCSE